MRNVDVAWEAIFTAYEIGDHDFELSPFEISAEQIKQATGQFDKTGRREVRVLCKQDTREARPFVFQKLGLFILPIRNGKFIIVKGEGYVDIPVIDEVIEVHRSALKFEPVTPLIGNSEMQHLDFAYAASIIRTFAEDESLVLTIRGRHYTPRFTFQVNGHTITADSVQTEVDAGYEGSNQVVLVEAKPAVNNTIIRQLYYPFRQWSENLRRDNHEKSVSTLFFGKYRNEYLLWQFRFEDTENYNSIKLLRSKKYSLVGGAHDS